MPKTIVTDSDTIQWLGYQNSPVADEVAKTLTAMKARGDKIYVTEQGWYELVEDPALLPRTAASHKELLKDFGIEKAPRPPLGQRVDTKLNDGKQRDQTTVKAMGAKDARMALQARDLGAEIYSVDRVYRTNPKHVAEQTGATVAPEVGRIPVGADGKVPQPTTQKDYRVARTRLNLPPVEIDIKGVVTRPGPAMPPPGASFKVPETQAMGRVQMRVTLTAAGVQIVLSGINTILEVKNEEIQRAAVEKALASEAAAIDAQVKATPHLGIIILYYYRQTEAHPDSQIKPGREFTHLVWGKGATIDEARADAQKAPTLAPGPSKQQTRFWVEQWIPPANPLSQGKMPFKPVAIAKFVIQKSEARFQGVKFGTIQGFDDTVEKTVTLLPGTNIEFIVLEPPTAVKWYNINGSHQVKVAVVSRTSSNGKNLNCVDLDTISPFHAVAAMVFPRDELASKIFELTAQTEDEGLLAHYINFRKVRWVRPQNIDVIQML